MANKDELYLILNLIADRIDEEISNLELELSDVEGLERELEWWNKEDDYKAGFILFGKPYTDNPDEYEQRPTGELFVLSGLRLLSEKFRDYGFKVRQGEESAS
jgi:hypothetical protein